VTLKTLKTIHKHNVGTSLTWFSLSTDALSRVTGQTVVKDQYPFTALSVVLDEQVTSAAFPTLQSTDFSYNKILFEADGPFSPGEHIFSLDYSPTPQSPGTLTLDLFLVRLGASEIVSASDVPLPLPAPSTVFASASVVATSAGIESVTTTSSFQGSASVFSAQVPETTIATMPASRGIRNDANANFIAFAMLAITLIRIIGW
jgi:hypothetical protein